VPDIIQPGTDTDVSVPVETITGTDMCLITVVEGDDGGFYKTDG